MLNIIVVCWGCIYLFVERGTRENVEVRIHLGQVGFLLTACHVDRGIELKSSDLAASTLTY